MSGSGPYDGEVMQLAAYCLLVEERYRQRVHYGQLQYSNRTIDVPFDDALRGRLFFALRAMRDAEAAGDVPRGHNSVARCRGCGFRHTCRDSLAPQ